MTYTLTLAGPGGCKRAALYDPITSQCLWADTGARVAPDQSQGIDWKVATVVSPSSPGRKSRQAKNVKIQLGLKCNYSCSYCNQRAQPHDLQGNPGKVGWFLKKFPTWFDLAENVRIEFWGGEPFVYWRTLKPLAEGLRVLYPKAEFNIITNASMLDDEKIEWLVDLGFQVGVSHDGPVYEEQRGADPLLIPEQRDAIRKLYDRLFPLGRFGFNAVLTQKNASLLAVRKHIAEHLGVSARDIPLSTEEYVLPYMDEAVELAVTSAEIHKRDMHTIFLEAALMPQVSQSTEDKISQFLKSLSRGQPASALGQKCGMDRDNQIAIDMNGNVLTCQNTSALTKHRIGHADVLEHAKLTTAHHWSTRPECTKCPVVHLCQGACLYLEEDLWTVACDTSWTYNLAMLAAAMFHATKMVLVTIEGPALRRDGVTSADVIDQKWFEERMRHDLAA